MKQYKTLWIAGSLICLSGEAIRKLAMLTAKKSFHHIVSWVVLKTFRPLTSTVRFRYNSSKPTTTSS